MTLEQCRWVNGIVVPGHGVASGQTPLEGCPRGTIHAQRAFFEQAGIDTSRLYDGTLNLDIRPYKLFYLKASLTLERLLWHPNWAPETFSLFICKIAVNGSDHDGYIYRPHPETKPAHFHEPHIVEVWAEYIAGVAYGAHVGLGLFPDLLRLEPRTPYEESV